MSEPKLILTNYRENREAVAAHRDECKLRGVPFIHVETCAFDAVYADIGWQVDWLGYTSNFHRRSLTPIECEVADVWNRYKAPQSLACNAGSGGSFTHMPRETAVKVATDLWDIFMQGRTSAVERRIRKD